MGCEDVRYSKTRQLYFLSEVCGTGKKSGQYLRRLAPGTEDTKVTVAAEGCRRCDNRRLYSRNLKKAKNPVHNSGYDAGDEDICPADLLPFLREDGFEDVESTTVEEPVLQDCSRNSDECGIGGACCGALGCNCFPPWQPTLTPRQCLEDRCELEGCCDFDDDVWQGFDHYCEAKSYMCRYTEGYKEVQSRLSLTPLHCLEEECEPDGCCNFDEEIWQEFDDSCEMKGKKCIYKEMQPSVTPLQCLQDKCDPKGCCNLDEDVWQEFGDRCKTKGEKCFYEEMQPPVTPRQCLQDKCEPEGCCNFLKDEWWDDDNKLIFVSYCEKKGNECIYHIDELEKCFFDSVGSSLEPQRDKSCIERGQGICSGEWGFGLTNQGMLRFYEGDTEVWDSGRSGMGFCNMNKKSFACYQGSCFNPTSKALFSLNCGGVEGSYVEIDKYQTNIVEKKGDKKPWAINEDGNEVGTCVAGPIENNA